MVTPRQDPTESQIEQVLLLKKEGVGISRMIKIVGLGRRAIERLTKSAPQSIRDKKGTAWLEFAMKDFEDGMNKKEISKKYKIGYTTVKERLVASSPGRGSSVLSPEFIKVKKEYLDNIKERNLKVFQDKINEGLDSKQLAEKYGISPKIVRHVCAVLGSPFKKVRAEKIKKVRIKKLKVAVEKKPRPKKVVVQRERVYAKKEVSTFRPGKQPKRTNEEEKRYSLKAKISGMITNDRISRKQPSITLPKISIQNFNLEQE